jgi:hypothetical protein
MHCGPLKKTFSKAFFYWLIFVLTTMFIYLFYNISMSDPSVNPLNDTGNMITYVMIIVIILCSIDILFANDFYVKLKGKDLAVRLICGGKFTQIAGFLTDPDNPAASAGIPVRNRIIVCMHSFGQFSIWLFQTMASLLQRIRKLS